MKAERGASNLRRFNAEREERFIPLLQEELKKCKKRKMQFNSLGNLAEYLASLTNIHRTTLTRNPRYKSILAAHLASQSGVNFNTSDDEASPEILRARLLASRLEISNLQEQIRRIRAHIERPQKYVESNEKISAEVETVNTDYMAFVDTAMALTAVLDRLKDSISIDLERQTIEDLAAKSSERIVAGPPRTAPYVKWLREHQSLLFGFIDEK